MKFTSIKNLFTFLCLFICFIYFNTRTKYFNLDFWIYHHSYNLIYHFLLFFVILTFININNITQGFILWLTYMGCLHTMNILHVYQIISCLVCILCRSYVETHDHLFFYFPFSGLWGVIPSKTLMSWPFNPWQPLL